MFFFDVDQWFGDKQDEIAEDYGFDEEQMEALDNTGNTLAEIAADMGYDIYADYENDVTEAAQEAADIYAMESYYERQFDEAIQYFQGVQKVFPEDYPSQLMIERCREFKVTPPPKDWNGVEIMKEK